MGSAHYTVRRQGSSAACRASAIVPLGEAVVPLVVGGSIARSGAARFSSSFSSMLGLGPWILHGRLGCT